MSSKIPQQDLQHIWHPCSQMKDYQDFPPLEVSTAKGSYIYLKNGHKIIDAISSWWCKSLGHNHSRLKQALFNQAERFEHIIHANTCSEIQVALATKLCTLMPSLDKVFFSGDGSCAIETALKMSIHYRVNTHQHHKTKVAALSNAYHGETLGTLSVSDLGLYNEPYKKHMFQAEFIYSIPYVTDINDPLWNDCGEHWTIALNQLESIKDELTAIIVEPIVQGAGGMKIYSADFLKKLHLYTRENDIHLIADEIMTGFYRTGKLLASEHADIIPDFLCLSKGLTAGWLPMSAVLTNNDVFNAFYDDYQANKSFLHSHTFNGNPLAAAIALEMFNVLEDENIAETSNTMSNVLRESFDDVAKRTHRLKNIRHIGAMVAGDLDCEPNRRMGFEVYKNATELGALLRPLGNTIYWLPPLNTSHETICELADITTQAIQKCK